MRAGADGFVSAAHVPHPKLEDILGQVGRHRLREGITAQQLRGIIFFQESADIEFIADTGEVKIQSCHVEQ
jgi:hypothetical protein